MLERNNYATVFYKEDDDCFTVKQMSNEHVHKIGNLNMQIYKCINEEYVTDEVIITEKQLIHIKEQHPEAYDNTISYIKPVLEQPDYIIKDKRPNTGLVIKQIICGEKHLLLVLHICTSNDKEYKNSIITGWEISDARLKNYLKNKPILYKGE